ncbi:TetR/AcrR family transcriptional regulator [Bosea sp. (in: a-proteobacteria)]|uniref:TetR/AcrR family transcriptional regulator n=1 Tax=Bosea sp. (in: a-proteobacteria) TaxID=1871050 RepID=UPI0027341FE1|nr:TetR/AcrR family transcriptional regulator [Bosea sp. (in: a-proteobacteria)]MDP3407617.1 TetR/AcrR family transcriptional regulator [Bosea sp. (in: a-proteobacteria)]
MRVSRRQAAENRERVIETASRLFRENGFDGIGLKDLMAGAGLTQGGFYKQFASKDELVTVATRRALESVSERWSKAAAARPDDSLRAVCEFYLSQGHSAERADGCPIVALGSDAARQGPEVKAAFEAGMLGYLDMVTGWLGEGREDEAMVTLSTMVGALLLSRIVNDETLAGRFLETAAASVAGKDVRRQSDAADDRPERMQ